MLKPSLHPPEILQTSLYRKIRRCRRCVLEATRTQVVYGRGTPSSALWFVGEAPGANEDEQGFAFVGRAGRLLDLCLLKKAITEFFITNIVKCRPPDNRDPTEDEVKACSPWLLVQRDTFNPRVIVAMGRYSIGHFLGFSRKETEKMTVGKQVGRVRPCAADESIAIMPTYHPAYLLRNGDATKGFLRQIDRARKLCDKLLQQSQR